MVKSFRHVCIIIEDIEKSLNFYINLLGFIVTKQQVLEGNYPSTLLGMRDVKLTYIKLQLIGNDTKLELYYFHKPKYIKHISTNHFALTVDNLVEEYNKLMLAGVLFLSPPQKAPDSNCMVCFCCDPDMNMIELVEDF